MPATAVQLLEREKELEEIERVLATAVAGTGALLTIEGEAGAGKTSLLDAVAVRGEEREMRVLRARAGEFERDFPYGVVRQLFEPLLSRASLRDELFGGEAAAAAAIFDPGAAPSQGVDPFQAQHGLYRLVAALTVSSPLLLLVDDAQWADVASLRALVYVGRRLQDLPVVVGSTVRRGEPGDHERLLDELRREPGAHSIEPRPLTVAATAMLIEAGSGRSPSAGLARTCCEAAAGNPFLLTELLRALDPVEIEAGDVDAERLAELAGAGASISIVRRLAQLGKDAIAAARAVAVLEPNAELRLIAALAGLAADATADACTRLVLAGLLSDSRPPAFVHPLVREAVLSEIPAPRRAADRAKAASLLAEDGADGDVVAAQLLLAEPRGDQWVAAALRSAATAALARGAPDGAVSYLRRALREPPAPGKRATVSRELGVALLRADDPEGIEVLLAVRANLEAPVERAEIAAELSTSLAFRGSGGRGAPLLEESLTEIREPDSELGLLLRGCLLMQAISGLERVPEGALPAAGERLNGDDAGGRFLLHTAAALYAFGLGTMKCALELAERAGLDPAAIEADSLAGRPPQLELAALTLCDRGEGIDELFDLMIESSKRRGTPPGMATSYGMRASCRYVEGDLSAAWVNAQEAIRLQPAGLRVGVGNWLGMAMRALTAQGEIAAAGQLFDDLWRGHDPGSGISGATLLVARGELRLASGRPAEARHDFLAAAERVRWLPYPNPELLGWRTGLSLAEAALGNEIEARRLASEAVELARGAGGARGIGISLLVQGTVAEGEERLRLLGDAVETLAGTRARLRYAEALIGFGASLRRSNRRRDAREPLRDGLELARRCGAVPLEERARAELAATGARARKVVFSGVESLTASELRVARMAAKGMTNREIAQALTVTVKTVETHMRHVFQKLDVTKRTELPAALSTDDSG